MTSETAAGLEGGAEGGPWERTVQVGEEARLGDGSYRVAGLYKLLVYRRNHQTLLLQISGRIEASGASER